MSRFGFLQCEWPASAFVGANLFQSGSTRFCPLETILVKQGAAKQSPAGIAPPRPACGERAGERGQASSLTYIRKYGFRYGQVLALGIELIPAN